MIAHRGLPAAVFARPEHGGWRRHIVITQSERSLGGQHDRIVVGLGSLDYAEFIAPKVVGDRTALLGLVSGCSTRANTIDEEDHEQ